MTRLWDAITGENKWTLRYESWVNSVTFSPDGNTIVTGSNDGTVFLRESVTGGRRRTLTGHTDSVWSVAFSPDGTTLATGSSEIARRGKTGTVRLWMLPQENTKEHSVMMV